MPPRKQIQSNLSISPELKALLEATENSDVTEEDLREQRISFAYGNALGSDQITKGSVRYASDHIRLSE